MGRKPNTKNPLYRKYNRNVKARKPRASDYYPGIEFDPLSPYPSRHPVLTGVQAGMAWDEERRALREYHGLGTTPSNRTNPVIASTSSDSCEPLQPLDDYSDGPPPPNKGQQWANRVTTLDSNWEAIQASLFESYTQYLTTEPRPSEEVSMEECACDDPNCFRTEAEVMYIQREQASRRTTVFCSCSDHPSLLMKHGFIPCSPCRVRAAVSLDLLKFYHCQWKHSPTSMQAFAEGLWDYHGEDGEPLKASNASHKDVEARKAIGTAYDVYRMMLLDEKSLLD
ncbi:hypothetical protein B9479_006135, partial [Cryptococcus floricola]